MGTEEVSVSREEGVFMFVDPTPANDRVGLEDYVRFWATGDLAKGEFHCSDCGYGVTVHRALPACPMCGSTSWEQADWSPFTRTVVSDL
jgi:rubrerythrin